MLDPQILGLETLWLQLHCICGIGGHIGILGFSSNCGFICIKGHVGQSFNFLP